MGPNIDYKGIGFTIKLASEHKESFIFVTETKRIDSFTDVFLTFERDFDVIDESPGNYLLCLSGVRYRAQLQYIFQVM